MHNIERVLSVVVVVLIGGVAWPQSEKNASDAKRAAAEPAKGHEGRAKPAAELQQLKDLVGNWRCVGKLSMGGKEIQTISTWKAAWQHDGWWLVAQSSGTAKGLPGKRTGTTVYGWDGTHKQFVGFAFNNIGGSSMLTSKGRDGDKMEWTGKAQPMGRQQSDMKETVTLKGPNEMVVITTGATGSWEGTCRK